MSAPLLVANIAPVFGCQAKLWLLRKPRAQVGLGAWRPSVSSAPAGLPFCSKRNIVARIGSVSVHTLQLEPTLRYKWLSGPIFTVFSVWPPSGKLEISGIGFVQTPSFNCDFTMPSWLLINMKLSEKATALGEFKFSAITIGATATPFWSASGSCTILPFTNATVSKPFGAIAIMRGVPILSNWLNIFALKPAGKLRFKLAGGGNVCASLVQADCDNKLKHTIPNAFVGFSKDIRFRHSRESGNPF